MNYYNVGKLLVEAGTKYGEGIINEYSKKLTLELGRGYTISALKRMRQFYKIILKGATMSHQLNWSHFIELLTINDINIINYYIKITIEQNLSVRELRVKIKNKEYERLDDKTKNKLILNKEQEINDFIKNPIIIKNNSNKEIVSEKVLHNLILEDISSFLKELGTGFSFIDSEYKIKIGDRYNYIDFLLYNINYNCYVVIELKVIELKKEHIGQITTYMNYINCNIKKIGQNSTIGIIICKKDNSYIMEYCSDPKIFKTTYEIKEGNLAYELL